MFTGDSRRLFCRDVSNMDCDREMQDDDENCGIEAHVRITPIGESFGDARFRTRSSFYRRKLIVEEEYYPIFDESRDAVDLDTSTFSPENLWIATKVQKEFTSYHRCNAEAAISNIRLLVKKAIQEGKYQKLSWGGHVFTWRGYLVVVTSNLQSVVRYRTNHYERTPMQVADGVKSRLSNKRKKIRNPIPESIKIGSIVDGIVLKTVDFGTFVTIKPDIKALIHQSELVQLMQSGDRPLEFGEVIQAEVLTVDRDLKRVSLRLIRRNDNGIVSS